MPDRFCQPQHIQQKCKHSRNIIAPGIFFLTLQYTQIITAQQKAITLISSTVNTVEQHLGQKASNSRQLISVWMSGCAGYGWAMCCSLIKTIGSVYCWCLSLLPPKTCSQARPVNDRSWLLIAALIRFNTNTGKSQDLTFSLKISDYTK